MAAASGEAEPLINDNPELQSYYQSLESRAGYRLVLGGTRHFGYWDHDTWFPFPITPSLRRMEQKMFERLSLPEGSSVLDAGCGIGHVALYMAHHGLRVTAIDVVEHHVEKARLNIQRSGLPQGQVTARRADYHNLDWIADASLDGVYTMETLVHATDLDKVLRGFYRVLKPGGRLVEHEYETRITTAKDMGSLEGDTDFVSKYSAMPLDLMAPGRLRRALEEVGFVDIDIVDYSENVRPMLRLFYWMAIVPYYLVKLLRLDRFFINTIAGVGGLAGQEHWKYISVQARKPGDIVESAKTK
ncbi:hypothetical protein diail_876 [Diaporthe ilicicola]|nr:hypothetical protein diail_876 [Diaporthe ilicicola]